MIYYCKLWEDLDSMTLNIGLQRRANPLATTHSFFRKHWQKLVALVVWLVPIGSYWGYMHARHLSLTATIFNLIKMLQVSVYGPLLYILIYALRPFTFFSSALLALAGGFLFGPVWGVLYTIVGANTSATVAYLIVRYFGQGTLDDEERDGFLSNYANQMRNNSFETVLLMRLLFLPDDLVNYLAGLLQIHWPAFFFATLIGSIPGTITFVLLGTAASSQEIEQLYLGGKLPRLDIRVLAISLTMFVVSVGLSHYFKRRTLQTKPSA